MELGATWMSGEKLEKHHRLSYYIAVHSDKTIAFISSMCWKMSALQRRRRWNFLVSNSVEPEKYWEKWLREAG